MDKIDRIILEMSLEDKVSLCTGADFWNTKAFEKYGIPSFRMSDGPHGLRYQSQGGISAVNDSLKSTCFPTAVTSGATWSRELLRREGQAIAEEAKAFGVDCVLGPGNNIKRNPLCGRNFEYFSEDPLVGGEMAAAFIEGVRSKDVFACIKHFAVNNQEYKRMNGDSQLDERAMREIYLAGFERAIRKAKPEMVMCSYNKVNGKHASDSKLLLTGILRDEWGFDGTVVTDWGALNDRIQAFRAGCDLNMPGGSKYMEKKTIRAVRDGKLNEHLIDASVRRILELAFRAQTHTKTEDLHEKEHNELALEIARQGAVLLKNQDNVLPVQPTDIVIIGSMAKAYRYQGSGSSHINPTILTSLVDAMPDATFCPCGDADGKVSDEELSKLAENAAGAKVAVVVAGLPEVYESEGFDREDMALPDGHLKMIEAVAKANPNTVVVLLGGSPMELPFADSVKAILYMGLSGQAGGQACADLLTGRVNPSGKLTETWPVSYSDVISAETFGTKNPEYRESIYVGYRYYDKAKVAVRYPFGHGLSYTSFEYSDLAIRDRIVTLTVGNTGNVRGSEVVQLYIAAPQDGIHRPLKELRDFEKVELEPGESKTLTFRLDDRSFALWSEGWKVQKGTYGVFVGSSSQDIRLEGSIDIEGEVISIPSWQNDSWYQNLAGPLGRGDWELSMGRAIETCSENTRGNYTMDNTILEMRESSLAIRLLYRIVASQIAKAYGGKPDTSDPGYRMMLLCAVDCPLRGTVISSAGMMTDNLAEGFVELANGHLFRGIRKMLGV